MPRRYWTGASMNGVDPHKLKQFIEQVNNIEPELRENKVASWIIKQHNTLQYQLLEANFIKANGAKIDLSKTFYLVELYNNIGLK